MPMQCWPAGCHRLSICSWRGSGIPHQALEARLSNEIDNGVVGRAEIRGCHEGMQVTRFCALAPSILREISIARSVSICSPGWCSILARPHRKFARLRAVKSVLFSAAHRIIPPLRRKSHFRLTSFAAHPAGFHFCTNTPPGQTSQKVKEHVA